MTQLTEARTAGRHHVGEHAERAGSRPGRLGHVRGQSAADLIAWDTAAAPSLANMIV